LNADAAQHFLSESQRFGLQLMIDLWNGIKKLTNNNIGLTLNLPTVLTGAPEMML